MIEQLIQKEVQEFIVSHEHDDEKLLVLKHKAILGIPSQLIAEQISARRKAKDKLPLYYNRAQIIYPPGINLEQSSSEKTAELKATILSSLPKLDVLVDATGGFGIDSLFLSRIFQTVYHVEPNTELQQIARHNHRTLNQENIIYVNCKVEDYFTHTTKEFDCVFIDPSRRAAGQKVFRLSDCEPNIVDLLEKFFERSPHVLIKTSPLLDIQNGLRELRGVETIFVVSVDNECKELLFLCNKFFIGEPKIVAVNLSGRNDNELSFTFSQERDTESKFSEPLNFIYEPNASILKAGAFKTVGNKFNLYKIHTNTHLYTSTDFVEDFPGRVFNVLGSVKDYKELKSFFTDGKANIITRNYPLTTDQVKKKMKLNDGGVMYLLAFTGEKKKYMLVCTREL